MSQADLLAHVAGVYADAGETPISNVELYAAVAERAGIGSEALQQLTPIGIAGQKHNLIKRVVRWHQQSLKEAGVLEHADARGVWRMASRTDTGLHQSIAGVKLVAFSTHLGVAVWGDCADIFARMDEPVSLVVTSPPYPLRKQRAYGGPAEAEYVDFILLALEPLVRRLAPSGSICLNISNDIFEPKPLTTFVEIPSWLAYKGLGYWGFQNGFADEFFYGGGDRGRENAQVSLARSRRRRQLLQDAKVYQLRTPRFPEGRQGPRRDQPLHHRRGWSRHGDGPLQRLPGILHLEKQRRGGGRSLPAARRGVP
ncbi:DNA methyltransferase [mine drainage metagenome]|uniref:site-specific DNA-methyltransferase (cytosine-N(4)-specific) n=1 Tax=mine drainage metagenome TaxID=410659 RepID=T1BIQ4_9ZZZZ